MKVLLIGDPMTDVNIFCEVRGLSREAAIPVLKVVRTDERGGGMWNVLANLTKMGATVQHLETSSVSYKYRVWADGQMICRYDRDGSPCSGFFIPRPDPDVRAIVISDYAKGPEIPYSFSDYRIPVFVDTKRPHLYYGASWCFPNYSEWSEHADEYGDPERFKVCVRKEGAGGCTLIENDTIHFVRHMDTEPVPHADTVGAGDTFLAAFVVAKLEGHPDLEACRIANAAAGIACQKQGTAVVSRAELENACPLLRSKSRNLETAKPPALTAEML